MKRSQRLKPVLGVAQREQDTLARHSQAARQQLQLAEDKLSQLRQYHQEYAQRLHPGQGQRLDIAHMQEARLFLQRLADAIGLQTQEVQRQQARSAEAEQAWIKARQHCQSLENLLEQYRAEERAARDRADQARADDLAGQRHVWLAGREH